MEGCEPNSADDLQSLGDDDNPTKDIHVNDRGLP